MLIIAVLLGVIICVLIVMIIVDQSYIYKMNELYNEMVVLVNHSINGNADLIDVCTSWDNRMDTLEARLKVLEEIEKTMSLYCPNYNIFITEKCKKRESEPTEA